MKVKVLKNTYIPGKCNIGPEERRLRLNSGILGLLVTLGATVALVAFNVPKPWRLTVFFPAMGAFIGLLQARFHFCVKFGTMGAFNFGPQVGLVQEVKDPADRKRDRSRVRLVSGLSLFLAAIFAVAVFLFPYGLII